MPPVQYTLIHPGAKLTDAERQTLNQGYAASLQANQGSAPSASAGGSASTAGATAAIRRDCGSCHAADPALAVRTSSTVEAQALVQDMVQRGAEVSAQDEQLMIQYWTR